MDAYALTFVNRMSHLRMGCVPKRSTLGDANAKRSESIFGDVYFSLLAAHRRHLLPDSRPSGQPGWLGWFKIIDSTTVTLFSSLVFRGVGRDPKLGKKKGGVKVHTLIGANEGVPGDIRFTSAATHDSFMLKPANFDDGDVLAMDRAYFDYEKFEELTRRGVTYVTKMKKNLTYETVSESLLLDDGKFRKRSVKEVVFHKDGTTHRARIVSYVETKTSGRGCKEQEVQLLTNSLDLDQDPNLDNAHRESAPDACAART